MRTPKAIDETLDALDGEAGEVEIVIEGARATVDVVAVDKLGLTVREVGVCRERPFDLVEECAALPDKIRSLPHRLHPVEVAPELGGGVLRSRPEEMRRREFFQVDLTGDRNVGVRRFRVGDDGQREQTDFTLTREQLGDLVEELG
jgi:hypothetical protein